MSLGMPSDGSGAHRYSEEKKPDAEVEGQDPQLLEQVLAATLHLTGADEPLQAEDMRVLMNVARHRKNEPLSPDTVLELVQSVLRPRFRRLMPSTNQWEQMTRQLAETLVEDPQAKVKLQQLWDKLCEAAK